MKGPCFLLEVINNQLHLVVNKDSPAQAAGRHIACNSIININREIVKNFTLLLFLCSVVVDVQAQWNGSNTTTGAIDRQGKVILNSSNWDDHLEISRTGFGGVFKPDNSAGYLGLRLDLMGTGSNFYVLNGNVGIGTATPGSDLDMKGYFTLRENPSSHVSGDVKMFNHPDNIWGFMIRPYDSEFMEGDFNWNRDFGYREDQQIWYAEGGFHVYGWLGVGTDNPDSELTVNGTVHCKEVKVDLDITAPDYVFEPDYDLPPLEEVKQYVQTHKHLPEVPSSAEMEENGLNLKEMNLLLLKKVEELTLYMIDQKGEIEDLKAENQKLQEQIENLNKQIAN